LYLTTTGGTVIANLKVAQIWSWVPQRLRVINRVQTQRQLRLIRLPTLRTDQDIYILGLDHQRLQLAKFEPESTPVALRNRVLATCKPVWH
jgi:hypothetical protein